MTTLRVTTKQAGVLTDVTSVTLADLPTVPAYGIRRTDTGAVAVAAGTSLVRVSTGVYEYEFADTPGVPYEWRFAVLVDGRTNIGGGSWVAHLTPAEATLDLTIADEVALANCDVEEAIWGEQVTIHPPGGADRVCTVIVTRDPPRLADRPREEYHPVLVSARNSTTLGIGAAEWTNQFTITLPRHRGSVPVTMRTVRKVHDDAARITWGCV
jgi:hypothetical protein